MTKLFQNDSTGILISVDITEDNIQTKLYHWLKENHGSIFYNDIEMHEGGMVKLEKYSYGTDIIFSGDNGILTFEECAVEAI